ncbi:MAG: hypothetical protein FWD31_02435, partial [Planctomycetaceae bacterium]|nr:hypothetical protein [Planctomycetaceae bacterium]
MRKETLLIGNRYAEDDGVRSDDNSEGKDDFCVLIAGLKTRERNALNAIDITTIEAFCEYNFVRLHGVRGYGETTVSRLQELQNKLCASDERFAAKQGPLSLHTEVISIPFSGKERKALLLLDIVTVEDFLKADLSQVCSLKNFGAGTRQTLLQRKNQILEELPDFRKDNELSLENTPVFTLELASRESAALHNSRVSTLGEFAWSDLRQMADFPNFGTETMQSLSSKQRDVRLKIISQEQCIPCIPSTFSCDDKGSVFLLDLTHNAKGTLWQLEITRISELVNANLSVLEHAPSLANEVIHELQSAKNDLVNAGTADLFNDIFSSLSLQQLAAEEEQIEILHRHNVDTARNFLFFSVPEEHIALRRIQSDWRDRYTPKDLLLRIPAYFNICFHQQRSNVQDGDVKTHLESFPSVTRFFSASFEDILELTEGDLVVARRIQSLQYEIVKSCLEFHKQLDFSSIRDERAHYWMREITKDGLLTLPFFSDRRNRGFAESAFHESFLSRAEFNKLTKSRLLLKAFNRIDITLGQLLLTPYSHLLLLKHFTMKCLPAIRAIIRKLLFLPPPPPLDKSTPDSLFLSLLKGYVSSEKRIRIALTYIHEPSCMAIAKEFKLSRERVRQIVGACKNPAGLMFARMSFAEVTQMLEFTMIKLGGFAHIDQITRQLAVDNGWNERDCTQVFVEFLFVRANDKFEYHGQGYYSTCDYPCLSCKRLNATVSRLKYATHSSLFSMLKNSRCSNCIELPRQVNDSFLDWRIPGLLSGYSKKTTIQQTVYNVLKSANVPLTSKEVHARIHLHAEGDDHYTEKQVKGAVATLCVNDANVYLWDYGNVYVHRRNVPTELPFLARVEKRLKEMIKLAKTPYVLLYTLYNEFASECQAGGITSAHALHACLKARNIPGIVFMRSPHVSTTDKKHKRMTVALLSKWIARRKSTVTYLTLKRYAKKIGLDAFPLLSNVTAHKFIARYGSKRLVHYDSLAWNQQKQERLLNVARTYWEHCTANHSLFARTDELLSGHKKKLPKLANNISWTSELIFSLLSRSDGIVTFGNTHLAYGMKTDDSPKSLGDIVAR